LQQIALNALILEAVLNASTFFSLCTHFFFLRSISGISELVPVLVPVIVGLVGKDAEMVRASYLGMKLITLCAPSGDYSGTIGC
jgi:hypothetical protein